MSVPGWLPDALGLIGSVVLLRPAFRLNSVAKLLWRLGHVQFDEKDDPFLRKERARLIGRFTRRRHEWNRLDEGCLFGGLGALILSFLMKVL